MIEGHLACAHRHLAGLVRSGDRVLDATVGNGHDTLFLARLVGPAGSVLAIDLQREALDAARARLAREAPEVPVSWRHGCHAAVLEESSERYRVAAFNLGYRPGGDHRVTTHAETSRRAIEAAIGRLEPGGGLSVICYRGHPGGQAEYEAVRALFRALAPERYRTLARAAPNRPVGPVCLLLEKATAEAPDQRRAAPSS